MSGPLEIYEVEVQGNRTTMKLTAEQAERMGAKKRSASNKARTADTAETRADDTGEDSLVCDECGFEAKTAGGLASHQRSHEG